MTLRARASIKMCLHRTTEGHTILQMQKWRHVLHRLWFYTLNHKKRDILFVTITLANLRRFL